MEDALRRLQSRALKDYVFHGSPRKLYTIEPRKARHADPNCVAGNQHAVYATHDVRVALIMALLQPKGEPSLRSLQGSDRGPLIVRGKNAELRPGFVYVLPEERFFWFEAGNERELISFAPVDPVETILVRPSILKLLGDSIQIRLEALR